MTITVNRHDEFQDRSYPCEIDADQIESVRRIDRRWGIHVLIRTKSGEQFACANDDEDVRARWRAALRPEHKVVTDEEPMLAVTDRMIDLERALRRLLTVHAGACRFDHHGFCQEHCFEPPCAVAAARTLLGERAPSP